MRPVNLQGIITRTQDVERLQRIQQNNPAAAQEQFSERLRKEAEENERRVRSSDETMPGVITEEKQQNQGSKKKNKKDKNADGDNSDDEKTEGGKNAEIDAPVKGRYIDVKA